MPIADLELSIRPQGAGYAAEARLRYPGSKADTVFVTDAPVVLDRSGLLALTLDTTAYGQTLTRQLFASQELRDAWRSARALADSGGLPLRLRLRLPAAAEDLHTLHWEALLDPLTGLPLATDTRVRLARFLDSADTRPITVVPRPNLRALVVVANPRDLRAYELVEIDVEGEVGRLRRALGSIPLTVIGDHDGALSRQATLGAIEEALRSEPAILCLLCHARQTDDDTMLWLEDDKGTTRLVPGRTLNAMITQLARPPLLATLIACDTGGALAAIGPRLAQGGLGAVIAMQARLSMGAARTFLPTLFNELVRDGAVDRAVAVARAALRDGDEWWAPALWLRTRDGQLWAEHTECPIDEALAQLAAMPIDSIPPPTPLPPGSHMPLARNPLFVGREADLRALGRLLKGARSIAAIGQAVVSTGMGGIGKTNLATEFAHRYGQFFAGGVYWLSFANPAGIAAEAATCGATMGIPGFANLSLADQLAQVRAAWQQPIPRLLIFDNCDDSTAGQAEALLRQWRPTTGGCRVLITSRRAKWSRSLDVTPLSMGVLARGDSIALLRGHRHDLPSDHPALDAIADELGDLPLALHLVGSFLETYQDSPIFGDPTRLLADLRDTRLLEHIALQGVDVTPSPTNHDLHVGRTFALSYDRLDATDLTDRRAAELLVRAAHLSPGEAIPRDLLLRTLELPSDDLAAQREAERGLRRLLDLGLLDVEHDGALRLHRLLAVFAQRTHAPGAEEAVERVVLARSDELNKLTIPTLLPPIQPHLRHVAHLAAARHDIAAARLHASLGEHLYLLGSTREARSAFERALPIAEHALGPTSEETLRVRDRLATVLKDLVRYDAAYTISTKSLARRMGLPTPNQVDIAQNLHQIADILQARGDYDEARTHYDQALELRAAHLGETHYLTLTTLNSLSTLVSLTDTPAVEELFARARESERKLLTASSSDDMWAGVAMVQAMFLAFLRREPDAAGQLIERARIIHLHLIASGRLDIPQELRQIVLEPESEIAEGNDDFEAMLMRIFGEFHPRTALGLMLLGMIHQVRGELADARRLYDRSLHIHRLLRRGDHLETAQLIWWRGNLFLSLRRRDAARNQLRRAVDIYTRLLTSSHPVTQRCQADLHRLDQRRLGKR